MSMKLWHKYNEYKPLRDKEAEINTMFFFILHEYKSNPYECRKKKLQKAMKLTYRPQHKTRKERKRQAKEYMKELRKKQKTV